MKKILPCIILILCCCLCVACSCGKDASISYANKTITVNVGDVYEIHDKDIEILYSTRKYSVIIEDESIATIDGMKIVPKKKGNTKIRFELTEEDGVYCEVNLIVTHNIFASVVSVEDKNVKIDINENMIAYNKISLNAGCNEVPQVTYDRTIIDYDYKSGRILGVREGETTVVVMYKACSVSFNVVVVGDVYVKLVETRDYEIYQTSAGKFEIGLFPDTANMYEFECDSDMLNIDKDGSYYAVSTGDVVVNIKYKTSEGSEYSYKPFNVKVLEPIDSFDVKLTNTEDKACSYYFIENKHRICISGVKNLEFENLAFSSNITIDSYYMNGTRLYIDFYFKNTGDNSVKIDMNLGGQLQLSETVSVHVDSYENIVVKAKWFVNSQYPLSDGKYHLYINSTTKPTYLKFSLEVNGVVMEENYKLYNVSTGTKVEIVDKFEPTIAGEYKLQFECDGEVLKTIWVVAS